MMLKMTDFDGTRLQVRCEAHKRLALVVRVRGNSLLNEPPSLRVEFRTNNPVTLAARAKAEARMWGTAYLFNLTTGRLFAIVTSDGTEVSVSTESQNNLSPRQERV